MTIDPLVAFMYKPIAALRSVKNGMKDTQSLQPGDILDVVVPAAGSGYLFVREGGTGVVKTSAGIAASSTTTVGPYNVQVEVYITSYQNDIALNIARLN